MLHLEIPIYLDPTLRSRFVTSRRLVYNLTSKGFGARLKVGALGTLKLPQPLGRLLVKRVFPKVLADWLH